MIQKSGGADTATHTKKGTIVGMGGLSARVTRAGQALRRDGLGGIADRIRLRLAYRHPGPWSLRLQGGHFRFAHRGELYAYVETFVRHVYDRVPGFTPADGQTVVDVGANVGCFTAYALHHMRRGRLCALEPNPDAQARLVALAAQWAPRRPHLRLDLGQAAVGAAPSQARFVVPAGASVRGAFAGLVADDGSAHGLDVEVVSLDDWLAARGVNAVDLLKIDVEGAEADVLTGAMATLAATRRVVLEWHGPKRLEAVTRTLTAAGFRPALRLPDPDDPQVGIAYFKRADPAPAGRAAPSSQTDQT